VEETESNDEQDVGNAYPQTDKVGWPMLVSVGAFSLLGLAAFLGVLRADQLNKHSKCVSANVLLDGRCDHLLSAPATVFLFSAIAAGVFAVAGSAAYLALRHRRLPTVSEVRAHDSDLNDDMEIPVRVCPACSAQARTLSQTCPYCGSSYLRSRRKRFAVMPFAERLFAGLAVGAIVITGAGAAAAVAYRHDRDTEASRLTHEELARQAAEEQAAAAQARAAVRQAAERATLARRKSLVTSLENAITRYASRESARPFAIIKGPVYETVCEPSGGRIETHTLTQDFDCLAVDRYTAGGGESGSSFSATVNYKQRSYTYQLGR
jgi:hypothetical protein